MKGRVSVQNLFVRSSIALGSNWQGFFEGIGLIATSACTPMGIWTGDELISGTRGIAFRNGRAFHIEQVREDAWRFVYSDYVQTYLKTTSQSQSNLD